MKNSLCLAFVATTYFILAFIVQFSLSSDVCEADDKQKWTYRGRTGPRYWPRNGFPKCKGPNQSPVNIRTNRLTVDPNLPPIGFKNFNVPITSGVVINDGNTVNIKATDGVRRALTIQHVDFEFILWFSHWNEEGLKGSPHSVDGRKFTLEGHFLVESKTTNVSAVVGTFYEEESKENSAYAPLAEMLSEIPYKGDRAELQSEIVLEDFVPKDRSYYYYTGSKTIPPCPRGVKWILFKEVIGIGEELMQQLRDLYSVAEEDAEPGCKMSGNFRPLQPLGNRKVYVYNQS